MFTETILVVEDEIMVRAPIARALRRCGYDVLEAEDGEHALRVLQEHHAPVPLVISDVVMPQLSGADLVEMLHGWYPRMRVLFISGYNTQILGAREEFQNCSFMAKPFSLNALTERARDLLDSYELDLVAQ